VSALIDRLIIISPYEEPRTTGATTARRGSTRWKADVSAGYVVASENSKAFDDPGIFVPIPLVNQIRPRVEAWRKARK